MRDEQVQFGIDVVGTNFKDVGIAKRPNVGFSGTVFGAVPKCKSD